MGKSGAEGGGHQEKRKCMRSASSTYGSRACLEEQRGLPEPLLARGVVGHLVAFWLPFPGACVYVYVDVRFAGTLRHPLCFRIKLSPSPVPTPRRGVWLGWVVLGQQAYAASVRSGLDQSPVGRFVGLLGRLSMRFSARLPPGLPLLRMVFLACWSEVGAYGTVRAVLTQQSSRSRVMRSKPLFEVRRSAFCPWCEYIRRG